MAPFQPKGDRSQRVIIAELTAQASPGDLLTFERLGRAIGVDPDSERDQVRQSVAAARDIISIDHNRALINVRGVGYRVARAGEHAGIAQTHRRKADKQVSRALAVISHTNEAEMTAAELQRHRAVEVVMRNLHNRMNSAESRLERLENVVAVLTGEAPDPAKIIPGDVLS